MKPIKTILLISVFMMSSFYGFSQFEVTGQYKARAEYLSGYQKPLLNQDDAGFYIAQRARLGGKYTHNKFQFNLTVQDVRTWGNTSHLAIDNNGLLSIFEANVALFLNQNWSVKVGRQPIAYDNDRIFGSLDWAMQARRHDAAIVQFREKSWSLDLGAAYNQEKPSNTHILYQINNYKTFQYLWANKKWNHLNASVLFLNNGMERHYMQGGEELGMTHFTQTFGTHLIYNPSKFNLTAYGYLQTGADKNNRKVSAYNASIAGTYKPVKNLGITLGAEVLSGTSEEITTDQYNKSFSPLYGTNHGFNGFMDYFYVGNHEGSVGLIDGFLKLNYNKGKFGIGWDNHLFFAAAPVALKTIPPTTGFEAMDPYLGYEIDLTLKYQYADEVTIQAGYSHLIGTSTLRTLKGGDNDKSSQWAYLMLTVNPFKNLKFK